MMALLRRYWAHVLGLGVALVVLVVIAQQIKACRQLHRFPPAVELEPLPEPPPPARDFSEDITSSRRIAEAELAEELAEADQRYDRIRAEARKDGPTRRDFRKLRALAAELKARLNEEDDP